MANY